MSALYTSTSVTLVALIFSLTGISGQSSPCPDVLEFKQDNSGSYGVITIPAPGKGQTIVNTSIAIYGETYNVNIVYFIPNNKSICTSRYNKKYVEAKSTF